MSDKVFPVLDLPTSRELGKVVYRGDLTKREMFAAMAMQGVLDCKLCGLCDALVRGAA